MNYRKEALKRAMLGIPIGIAIGATCVLIIAVIMSGDARGYHAYYNSLNFYVISYILSAIIGAVFGATSVIWEVEKFSLRTQTILHFLITIITHLTCAIVARWVPVSLGPLLLYAGIYVAIYVITFIIVYNVQKKRINEVNEVLEE